MTQKINFDRIDKMHLVIHTDGGARGNPGPAASAFVVHNGNNELLHSEGRYLGETTNNVAEYTGLLLGLEWARENSKRLDITKIDILMDSELVVKQMRGEYKIKNEDLQILAARVKKLVEELSIEVSYIHIPRAKNSEADTLVNKTLDAKAFA